jgi:hypothetical protein
MRLSAWKRGLGMGTVLFDIQCGFGGARYGEAEIMSRDDCLTSMACLQIAGALVRTAPDDLDVDARLSNELLFEACHGHDSLIPCPVIIPATAGDLPPEDEQVDKFIRQGAGAATIRPKRDYWELLPWIADALFAALAARCLPLFCSYRYVTYVQVAEIATRWPDLPIILAEAHYNSLRTLLPLLQHFPNVHLSLGENVTQHRGVEWLVAHVGVGQLLFGTGFPRVEPMMAVTQFLYADIPAEARRAIGAENARRLLEGVQR